MGIREAAQRVGPRLPNSSHHESGLQAGMSGILSERLSFRCSADYGLLGHNRACSWLRAFVRGFVSVSESQREDSQNPTGALARPCRGAIEDERLK